MRIPLLCAALALTGLGAAPALAADDVQAPTASLASSPCYIPGMVAHRGGGGVGADPYYYENSWVAFNNAITPQVGAKIIETDIRWTKDNVPFIFHDRELDHHSNGVGNIDEVDAAYVRTLELKRGGGPIPEFEDFLKWAKENQIQVFPEYKPESYNRVWIEDYARLVKEYLPPEQAVIPSFHVKELAEFKELLPDYPQIWFHDVIKQGITVKPDMVPPGAWAGIINIASNKEAYTAMQKAGITLYTWYNKLTGGDNPDGWGKMAALHPQGIITDYPEEYNKWAQTTTYCLKGTPQKAKCAKLPKQLAANTTTVLLGKTCKTNAGVKVVTKVKGKGKLVKGAKGKISVKTGAKGKVTITYSAKKKGKYEPFSKTKSYELK